MHSCHSLIYVSFSDMMQGDKGNIKEVLGIASFTDYLAIHMIYHCVVVFCIYSGTALYNSTQNSGGSSHSVHSWQDHGPAPGDTYACHVYTPKGCGDENPHG